HVGSMNHHLDNLLGRSVCVGCQACSVCPRDSSLDQLLLAEPAANRALGSSRPNCIEVYTWHWSSLPHSSFFKVLARASKPPGFDDILALLSVGCNLNGL
ncbi:hypothetical protein KUCAC02_025632, partial [Chaenocephalus aceratus]